MSTSLPAPDEPPPTKEKRTYRRIAVSLPVRCELPDQTSFTGVVRDISLGGMFIETSERPGFGVQLSISVLLPGSSSEVRLPGFVRWQKDAGFGIQFGLLGAREAHLIAGVVHRPVGE